MSGRFRLTRFIILAGFALSAALGACAPFSAPATPSAIAPPSSPTAAPTEAPTTIPAPTPVPTVAPSPTATPATLQDVVDQIVAQTPATVGFYAENLQTGQAVSANADLRVESASLYKLFVLYSTYAQMSSGQISPNETISLSHAAFVGDPYNEWPEGTSTTVSCATQYMIEVSSNSAAEMLLERDGGPDRVNADMKALGLTHSEITDDAAYTSAGDVAHLLKLILTKRAVNPAASGGMLQLLLQQRRNDRLPMVLPPGIPVAHKTGELTNLRNDAGIVFAPSGPYLFAALVSNAQNEGYARDTIQDLARVVYTAFEPGGVPSYDGLAPRLAAEIFQVPDSRGRLSPIDEWNEVVSVAGRGIGLTATAKDVQLQEPAISDLFAMQQASANANATFWVAQGYVPPRAIDRPMVDPTDAVDCAVTFPPPPTPEPDATSADTSVSEQPAPSPTPSAPPHASQQWLGTVVEVSDRLDGPASGDFRSSAAGQWLLANSWEYGFIPALPETSTGAKLGYEPTKFRWVGTDLARQIHDQSSAGDYAQVATTQLRQAEADLAAEAAKNQQLVSGGK